MKILSGIFTLALAMVAAAFAIANREEVAFRLDPLPYVIEMPLFVISFSALFIGILIGALAMWLRDGKVRKRVREERRVSTRLRNEMKVIDPKTADNSAS